MTVQLDETLVRNVGLLRHETRNSRAPGGCPFSRCATVAKSQLSAMLSVAAAVILSGDVTSSRAHPKTGCLVALQQSSCNAERRRAGKGSFNGALE